MRAEPWFMLSPSILSLSVYWFLVIVAVPHLSRAYPYSRARRFSAIIDLFFVVGLMVFISDFFWCLAVFVRWVPSFPQENLNVLMYLGRDAAGAVFCYLLCRHLFVFGILKLGWRFVAFLVLDIAFKFTWFFLAPSPAWTDYVFAWKNGFSLDVVLGSFFISHFIGRLTFAGFYLNAWTPSIFEGAKKWAVDERNQNIQQKRRPKDTARSHTEKETIPSEKGKAAIPLIRNSLL